MWTVVPAIKRRDFRGNFVCFPQRGAQPDCGDGDQGEGEQPWRLQRPPCQPLPLQSHQVRSEILAICGSLLQIKQSNVYARVNVKSGEYMWSFASNKSKVLSHLYDSVTFDTSSIRERPKLRSVKFSIQLFEGFCPDDPVGPSSLNNHVLGGFANLISILSHRQSLGQVSVTHCVKHNTFVQLLSNRNCFQFGLLTNSQRYSSVTKYCLTNYQNLDGE